VFRVTRTYRFSASHRLHVEELGEEQNHRLFGKCNNPYGHGHNYTLHVTAAGDPDGETGLALNRRALDELVEEAVLARIDRRDMNADVAEFQELVPTTENLARVTAEWLCREWSQRFGAAGPRLSRIRLEETGRNTFDLDLEL